MDGGNDFFGETKQTFSSAWNATTLRPSARGMERTAGEGDGSTKIANLREPRENC